MRKWIRYFDVGSGLKALLKPVCVCQERQSSPAYVSQGRLRATETHCIFHYCLRGAGRVRYKNRTYEVLPQHGFLCVINDPDMDYFYPENGTGEWEFVWFAYQGGDASVLTTEMIATYGPVFHLPDDAMPLKRLRLFGGYPDVPVELNCYDGAMLVDSLLFALGAACEAKTADRHSTLIRGALALLKHSARPLNVTELSLQLHVSREHLSRAFKKETGTNLKEVIAQKKTLQACQQLMNADLTVGMVAKTFGFANASNFSRMFRTYTGMTPNRFRAESENAILAPLGNVSPEDECGESALRYRAQKF
jgi:AraC-like DNA-binding protein